ncbi:manganese catalase family protein [Bacillus sp. T33-2]|uniref:manganese catalase family protein n=1 Tax=Bacillus sp. T33-2 TaxID=2054168 RepID=UPI000C7841A1|nr:manganese catalase family protein [Bacillus sp. T33-2]PLR97545.1 manganese catalase [Bacillus sp. T33-2]
MFKRFDQLLIDLPAPDHPDPDGAAAAQELLGGKFGEMSTLNNYMFQSFNFRGKNKLRPFFDLVASITAEELGHVELVTHAINMSLEGVTQDGEPDSGPLKAGGAMPNKFHFIPAAQSAIPGSSSGQGWTGDNVFNSGNLILDLLHNFFLECGARTHKMRVYEMTDSPVIREMVGYLLVRGGVHVVAYAKALEVATGVDIGKMLPIPSLDNKRFDHARKYEEQGIHQRLYTWSDSDYRSIDQIWKGNHPIDGQPLFVTEGMPEGFTIPEFSELPQEFAPGIGPDEFMEIANRLQKSAGL